MRQDSRANAAIFILDEFLAGQNLNAILSKWTKANRYAGSSDRESIRDIVFDISKTTFQDFPSFTSITQNQRVQLQSTNKHFDDVLNNWDTTIVAGDILNFNVVSVNNIRRLLISLKLKL